MPAYKYLCCLLKYNVCLPIAPAPIGIIMVPPPPPPLPVSKQNVLSTCISETDFA